MELHLAHVAGHPLPALGKIIPFVWQSQLKTADLAQPKHPKWRSTNTCVLSPFTNSTWPSNSGWLHWLSKAFSSGNNAFKLGSSTGQWVTEQWLFSAYGENQIAAAGFYPTSGLVLRGDDSLDHQNKPALTEQGRLCQTSPLIDLTPAG